MYNKNNLLPAFLVNKKERREILKHVLFNGKVSVATDSYILLEVTSPQPERLTNFALNAKQLQNIKYEEFVILPKNQQVAEIKDREYLCTDITITTEKFPKYYKVFPKSKPRASVILDPNFVIKMAKLFKKAGVKQMQIEIHEEESPVVFSGSCLKDQKLRGVIMPIRK